MNNFIRLSVPQEVLCFTAAETQIIESKYKESAGTYFHKCCRNAEILKQEVAGVLGRENAFIDFFCKLNKSQKFRVGIRLIN